MRIPKQTDVPGFPAHMAEQIAQIIKVINEHVKRMSPLRITVCGGTDGFSQKPIASTKILLSSRGCISHVQEIAVHKCENWIHV